MYNYIQYIPRRFTLVLFDLVDYILVFSRPLNFINPDIIIFANINRFPNIDQVRQQILPSLHVLPQQTLHLTCQENWISANYQRIFKTRIKLSCHVTHQAFSPSFVMVFQSCSVIFILHNGRKIQKGTKESMYISRKNNDMQSVHISNQN